MTIMRNFLKRSLWLKCEYDLDYIIKYVSCKKNQQLQLQVSNICHVNNIFKTCCCTITKRPIDLKLGLSIQNRVVHVGKERFF